MDKLKEFAFSKGRILQRCLAVWLFAGVWLLDLSPGYADAKRDQRLRQLAKELEKVTGQGSKSLTPSQKLSVPHWGRLVGLAEEILGSGKIQEGDSLEFYVYPQEELSATRTVDSDGYIFFPYLGRVKASGLTPDELARRVVAALEKDHLQNPRIMVRRQASVADSILGKEGSEKARVKPIKILGGGVVQPGTFYVTRSDPTLLEAILDRGGFSDGADMNKVKLIRTVKGKPRVSLVAAGDILDGKEPDIRLRSGDLIIVPKGGRAIYILGEVKAPGALQINEFFEGKMTLIDAITRAGGFSRSAARSRVRIVRVIEGKEKSFRVNVDRILKAEEDDVVLEPGDIVVVPEAFW